MKDFQDISRDLCFVMKLIALCCCLMAFILIYATDTRVCVDYNRRDPVVIASLGYTIIMFVFVAATLTGTRSLTVEIMLLCLGVVFCFLGCGFATLCYNHKKQYVAGEVPLRVGDNLSDNILIAVFCFSGGICMVVDILKQFINHLKGQKKVRIVEELEY